jgi:hypothetical protein
VKTSNKSVLAGNPLDLILSPRQPAAEEPRKEEEKAPPSLPKEPVSRLHSVAAPVAPVAAPTPPEPVRTAIPAQIEASAMPAAPTASAATAPSVSSYGLEAGALSHANRVGTHKQPYLRKKDGVETRQSTVTLSVDTLRKLNHLAVETGRRTSSLVSDAVEEYLRARNLL